MKNYLGILLVMTVALPLPVLTAANTALPELSPSVGDAKISLPDLSGAVMSQFDTSPSAPVALTAAPATLAATPLAGATMPVAAPTEVKQSQFRIAIYSPGSPTPDVVTASSLPNENRTVTGYGPMRYWGRRFELQNGYIGSVYGYGASYNAGGSYGNYGYSGANYGYSGNRGYSNYGYSGYQAAPAAYVVAPAATYRVSTRAPVATWYLHN